MISQAVVTCTLCMKLFFNYVQVLLTGFITESCAHIKRIMRYVLFPAIFL